jgi:hypothetical protein
MNPIEPKTESGKRLKSITMPDSNETLKQDPTNPSNYCPSHGEFDRKLTRILTSLPFLADEVSHTRDSVEKIESLVRDGFRDIEQRTNARFDAQDKRIDAQDKLISSQKSAIKILAFKVGGIIGGIGIIGLFFLNKIWDFVAHLVQS